MTGPAPGSGSSTSPAATSSAEAGSALAETRALQDALAAEHAAIWGYGTVGAALPAGSRAAVVAGEQAHRDLRDRVSAVLEARDEDPVPTMAGYALPFPVLSAVDAAALAATLEEGTTATWVWVLDQAADRSVRELAVAAASAAEVRAVAWRVPAGRTPVTTATPGLPAD